MAQICRSWARDVWDRAGGRLRAEGGVTTPGINPRWAGDGIIAAGIGDPGAGDGANHHGGDSGLRAGEGYTTAGLGW